MTNSREVENKINKIFMKVDLGSQGWRQELVGNNRMNIILIHDIPYLIVCWTLQVDPREIMIFIT
jgi:hypothetical protein